MDIYDLVQGTDEWFQARSGIVTASAMSNVLAKGQGKTRKSYMYKLIGERFTGEPAESFSNSHTERGHEQEPIARLLYSESTGNVVSECGFMREGDIGYSPDGLIGDQGLLEIKTRLPHLMAETLDTQKIPSAHTTQIQCGLYVSGREWLDFVAYCPSMPLFISRVSRDDEYIDKMIEACKLFYADMDEILTRIVE